MFNQKNPSQFSFLQSKTILQMLQKPSDAAGFHCMDNHLADNLQSFQEVSSLPPELESGEYLCPKWFFPGHFPSWSAAKDQLKTLKNSSSVVGPLHSSKKLQMCNCMSLVCPCPSKEFQEKMVNCRDHILPIPITGVPSPWKASGSIFLWKFLQVERTEWAWYAGWFLWSSQNSSNLFWLGSIIWRHAWGYWW